MARFVLLNLRTSGLKCLEKEINIQFYKRNIKDLSLNDSVIKAIYGTNGEGKTAIALTLQMYKNSVLSGDYLAAQSFNSSFSDLINQQTHEVKIDLYFAVIFKEEFRRIFRHIIEFKFEDGRIFVSRELISDCGSNLSWGTSSNEVLLLETNNGKIDYLYKKSLFRDVIYEKAQNLVSNSSAVYPIVVNTNEYFGDTIDGDENLLGGKRAHFAFMSIIAFALSLQVYIDKVDQPYLSTERIQNTINNYGRTAFIPTNQYISDDDDEIRSSDKDKYQKEIGKIEKMLRVFKSDLKKIDVKFINSRGNRLIAQKTLVYQNGDRVALEYESTGIKKLVRLFNSLNSVDNGGVVFIDEFDANIHDVYLCKLIEYFSDYSNGQFIFTTHNLGPMEVLDKKGLKHSIDFVNKQTVSSWKKNGNYSVVKVYRNGMIPNSPFNIDSVDFVKVFGGGNSYGNK